MSSAIRRAVGLAGLTGIAVVGVQVLGVPAAQAHDNTVVGVAACQKDGTYTVAWYVRNTYPNEGETATVIGYQPTASKVGPTAVNIPASGTGMIAQAGIPGNATVAGLAVSGHWYPDNFQKNAVGWVKLPGTCTKPATVATPVAPAVDQSVCTGGHATSPRLTTRQTPGIVYTASPSGPYRSGEKVTVTAQAKPGYRLGAEPSWTNVGGNRATRTVTLDEAPTCAAVAGEADSRPAARGPLANTGPHTTQLLAIGLGSVLTGLALLVAARRRTT